MLAATLSSHAAVTAHELLRLLAVLTCDCRNGAAYAYTGTQQKFININAKGRQLPKLRREPDAPNRECSCDNKYDDSGKFQL